MDCMASYPNKYNSSACYHILLNYSAYVWAIVQFFFVGFLFLLE
jgi:hypothetical protein